MSDGYEGLKAMYKNRSEWNFILRPHRVNIKLVPSYSNVSKYLNSLLLSRVSRGSRAEPTGDKFRSEPHRIKRLARSIY